MNGAVRNTGGRPTDEPGQEPPRRAGPVTAGRRVLFVSLIVVAAAVAVGAAVWLWPEPPERRFIGGLEALTRGDFDEADAAIESLRDEPGFEDHLHLLQGAAHLQADKPRAALRELALVEPAGELLEPAYLLTGEALYKTGQLAEAEQIFLRYDRVRPDDPQACRWLAAIYYDLGAMHHAIDRLEQLARLEPDDYSPHRLLGLIRLDFEHYAEAIDHYQEALRRSPPDGVRREIVRELARAMIRELRYDEALAVLGEADAEAEILAMRAECHWSLGRRDEAWRLWEQAAEFDPRHRSVRLIGARIHLDSGKPDEAVALLSAILENDPHDAEARYQLAMAYRQMGRNADVERELSRHQVSNELRTRLAELNIRAMDEPRNAELRDELADVCRQLGKDDLAAMWQKAAEDCRRFQSLGE